jgi:lysophospholipase L1-like esterase
MWFVRIAAVAASALALAGCGDGAQQTPSEQRVVVSALGDSITSGSPGYDPVPERGRLLGLGSNEQSQWEYWASRADPRLRVRNCGVYGELTSEIARRLEACANGADVLVVQGGINDLAQGLPVDEAARNLLAMVRHGKALGLRVEIAELIPWNNGYPRADESIRALNRRIHRLARDEGIRVLPFYRTLEDPAHPGRMKGTWTADGDHPSVTGYRRLGELAFPLPGGLS